MSKSVELLASSQDIETVQEEIYLENYSQMNLNGNRQLSHSAVELRKNPDNEEDSSANYSLENRHICTDDDEVVQHIRHHRHISVAQRTHTFFATLKSRLSRTCSKERKKFKDVNILERRKDNENQKSDYTGDYSSEHSRSSSATHSPAKYSVNHTGMTLLSFTVFNPLI